MVQCLGPTPQERTEIQRRHLKTCPGRACDSQKLYKRSVRTWLQTRSDERFVHVAAAQQHARARRWSAATSCLTLLRQLGESRCHDVRYGSNLQSVVDCAGPACALSKQWQASLALLPYSRLQQVPDRTACLQVGSKVGAENRWQQALAYFRHLLQFGMRPYQSYYSATMHACGQALRWAWGIDLLWHLCSAPGIAVEFSGARELETLSPFDQAAHVCRDAGSPSGGHNALKILKAARQFGAAKSGLYVQVMSACCRSRMWASALAVLDQVEIDGLQPSLRTCTAASVAWELGLHWESAGLLLDCMDWKWHLNPHEGTYRPVMEACHKASSWVPMLVYLRDMPAKHGLRPKAERFASAARALLKHNHVDQALGILRRMQDYHLDVSIAGPIIFTAGMGTFAASAAWSRAGNLLCKYSSSGLEVDIQLLCACATAFRRAGSWVHVICLLGAYDIGADITAQNLAVGACAHVGATAGPEWAAQTSLTSTTCFKIPLPA